MLLLLFSCGSGENVKEGSEAVSFAKAVSFEKLDSIKIDYLGNPTVHDLDPVSRTVLFMEHKESSQLIAVANFEGEVLYSFTKWGDLPDSYGNLMAPLKIIGSDTFMAYGSRGFFTYTFDGKLQSIVKHANSQYRGFNRIGLGVGMEPLGDGYLYHNGNDGKRMPNGTEDYSQLMPLIFLYPSIGETTPVLHFSGIQYFFQGQLFFQRCLGSCFYHNGWQNCCGFRFRADSIRL
ncbi:hypothetical protein [Negadavirga shengliensis]|uniref:Uncharacterized protein n=1 Tax=Negadavirga shengliensis TaxID=1389218 RepID=A0ABV9T172_9BACT